MVKIIKFVILGTIRRLGYKITKAAPVKDEAAQASAPELADLPDVAALNARPSLSEYFEIYGEAVTKERPFLNIGAGSWKHPAWKNVEYPSQWYAADLKDNIDIVWDAGGQDPLPVPSDSIELIFCSHTAEHILTEHAVHMFEEAYRVLKPGGAIRVTCPDFSLYYNAYLRGDKRFFPYPYLVERFPLEQVLVYECASMLSECEPDMPGNRLSTDYIRGVLKSLEMDDALNEICSHIDYARNREKPNHVSWWTPDKMIPLMRKIGFNAYRSAHGQSGFHVMRDAKYFDTTEKARSLYVEAVKI